MKADTAFGPRHSVRTTADLGGAEGNTTGVYDLVQNEAEDNRGKRGLKRAVIKY